MHVPYNFPKNALATIPGESGQEQKVRKDVSKSSSDSMFREKLRNIIIVQRMIYDDVRCILLI
jgi:hypothetical protein